MSKQINLIKVGVQGVDGFTDPTKLGNTFRHAVNLEFQNGRVKTRPGFNYSEFGVKGVFQGVVEYRPSLGISHMPHGGCGNMLVSAVSGELFVNNTTEMEVLCPPSVPAKPEKKKGPCEVDAGGPFLPVNIFQAENYFVVQGSTSNTLWCDWGGGGKLEESPGMVSADAQTSDSADSFQKGKHKNWLINGAGVGVFWNGRIHQQGSFGVFVGDLIHKRGFASTDDILLMEEQALACCGPPLSTNGRLGTLVAIEGVAQMGTPNGEGALIGYYERGVVEYNTFIFPRASRFSAKGERLESGWDTKQMVKHLCNTISASGRYAVCSLPRDHFFRSSFGVHVLSRVLGVEFVNDEPTNVISDEVSHILGEDDTDLLSGVSCGCWFRGHRWFTTTGMAEDKTISATPFAKGFVSWNKSWSKTKDKTPITAWEGLWTVDGEVAGIHRFVAVGKKDRRGNFGFVSSTEDSQLWFASLTDDPVDTRDGEDIDIPWALETGRFDFNDVKRLKTLQGGRLEVSGRVNGLTLKVYVRTDHSPAWSLWTTLSVPKRQVANLPIGKPGTKQSEATWFEFRIEGDKSAEIISFDVEVSESSSKIEQKISTSADDINTNPFTTAL